MIIIQLALVAIASIELLSFVWAVQRDTTFIKRQHLRDMDEYNLKVMRVNWEEARRETDQWMRHSASLEAQLAKHAKPEAKDGGSG